MKALTFAGRCEVRVESVDDPVLESATDAIVDVRLAGICGSDLHVYHEREKGIDPGTTLGHELVGTIVEVGRGVETLRPGDRVACPFTTSCGRCFYCVRGLTCRCPEGQLLGWVEKGRGLQGAQAELVRVPLADSSLVKLPGAVSDEAGLLLGDVLPTGWFAADIAGVDASGTYAVIGCGPVGLMAVLACRERGAGRILAIDRIPARLERARALGAETLDAADGPPVDAVRARTGGRGADAVLEVVGSPEATRLAVDLVRPGGVVASVGVHTEEGFSFSPVEAYDKNLTYRSGRCPARHYMTTLVPLLERLGDAVASMVSHRMPLQEGPRGYALFDAKEDGCTKVVLTP